MDTERFVIGVDIGGTKTAAALVRARRPRPERPASADTETPEIVERFTAATDTSSPEATVRGIVDCVARLRQGSVAAQAVGVGVASMVDFAAGRVIESVNLPLADVALRDLLYRRFSLPTVIDNDANVAALGEWAYGAGVGARDMIMLTLGTGVGGGIVNEISKALGMNVTLKPAPESYELLSSGVMDGTLFPAESTESFKIDKIIKHATFFPGGLYNTSFVFMMNQAKYDKLTADEKKAVDAISGEVAARIYGRGWDRVDRRGIALMQANNVQIVKADAKFVSDVKAKVSALEQNWVRDAEAKGLKDAAKVLAEFRSEIAKASK